MNWHDLAFYDADLFESLRKLIYQSTKDPNYLKQLDMTFEIVDSGKKPFLKFFVRVLSNSIDSKLSKEFS